MRRRHARWSALEFDSEKPAEQPDCRWRIKAAPSGMHEFDPAAPGRVRFQAELVRRRDGPPGAWTLEQDDETGRLGVVAGLAGHGLDATDRQRPATASAAA